MTRLAGNAKIAVVVLLASLVLLGACTREAPPTARADECVILLHGLARTALSMHPMKRMLEQSGYQVANVDYPSRDHRIEVLAPMAIEDGLAQCNGNPGNSKVHFVTHSLGGILVRVYTADHKIANLGRVVMLAPPNQGSHAVDELVNTPGPESVPIRLGAPDFDFAVIAGNRSIDPITSAVLPDPDDGRVSVADTRLQGMRDFVVVPVSHAPGPELSRSRQLQSRLTERIRVLKYDGQALRIPDHGEPRRLVYRCRARFPAYAGDGLDHRCTAVAQ
jgi:pimeloyl-ACP methyl ester carboxylesterase